jgi:hypothetical protein
VCGDGINSRFLTRRYAAVRNDCIVGVTAVASDAALIRARLPVTASGSTELLRRAIYGDTVG